MKRGGYNLIERVAQLLQEAKRTAVFTGAGMSTESGIPDFRSAKRGLWTKFNPMELAHVDAITNNTDEFIEFYQGRLNEMSKYKPHRGHYILGEWEQTEIIDGIITQNVDTFHYEAGNENVMELHGSFRQLHCHNCQQVYKKEEFVKDNKTHCDCGGVIRPSVVLFGEQLPQDDFQRAELLSSTADLFIVLGSSLTVSPANMFPLTARNNGAKLVIINRDPTDFDSFAELVIQDLSIKEALMAIDEELA